VSSFLLYTDSLIFPGYLFLLLFFSIPFRLFFVILFFFLSLFGFVISFDFALLRLVTVRRPTRKTNVVHKHIQHVHLQLFSLSLLSHTNIKNLHIYDVPYINDYEDYQPRYKSAIRRVSVLKR
jgi:hypothetical protein